MTPAPLTNFVLMSESPEKPARGAGFGEDLNFGLHNFVAQGCERRALD
jgi:hypothetical protein